MVLGHERLQLTHSARYRLYVIWLLLVVLCAAWSETLLCKLHLTGSLKVYQTAWRITSVTSWWHLKVEDSPSCVVESILDGVHMYLSTGLRHLRLPHTPQTLLYLE